MRTTVIVALSAVLGLAAGLGITWNEFSHVEEAFRLPAENDASATSNAHPSGSHGHVVVVNGEDHDFGSMERETERSHVFVLKNEGTAAVKLTKGTATCKCTQFNIAKDNLEPGETTDVLVTWKPVVYELAFHQRAEVLVTNDPDRPIVSLTIRGLVVQNLRADPESLVLNDLTNATPVTRQVRIFAYYNEALKVVDQKFDDPETASFYNVTTTPLPPADLQKTAGAKSGVLATITVQPGLPLGAIHQTIRLVSNDDKGSVVALPVEGTILSDISLSGDPRFRASTNVLKFGEVSSEDGAVAKLLIFVRGAERNNVEFSLGKIDPAEHLQVTLGPAKPLGNVTTRELSVRVPADTPIVNRLGTPVHASGEIIIKTTHPHVPELKVKVQFAVTQ